MIAMSLLSHAKVDKLIFEFYLPSKSIFYIESYLSSEKLNYLWWVFFFLCALAFCLRLSVRVLDPWN